MSFDESLIRRLHPVLDAAVPAPGEPVHAEALHQLCLADSLLELLDWSSQGIAADPLACMWLGSLRWHRLMTGEFPPGAPQPPPREADGLLRPAFSPAARWRSCVAEGSGASSLAGLASGEMGHPSSPNQSEQADAAALLRVVPLGLVPYAEEEMRLDWADQAVCLTHGAGPLRSRARRLAALVTRAAAHAPSSEGSAPAQEGLPPDLGAELEALLEDADPLTSGILRRQLIAAAGSGTVTGTRAADGETAGTAMAAAVERLSREWERITAPRQ